MSGTCTAPSVFHVGYPKTATTFLQERVFNREDLGVALGGGDESRAYLVENYMVRDDYIFDSKSVRADLDELEKPQRERGLLPVWSEEMFLGAPAQRQYHGPQVQRKLAQTHGGDAKILITIREQRAMALSAYREYVRGGGRNPLRDFIGTRETKPAFSPLLRESFLHYDRAVAAYMDSFGRERVLVLPIELLTSDPQRYLHMLGQFFGLSFETIDTSVRANKGAGLITGALNRQFNKVLVQSPLELSYLSLSNRVAQRTLRLFDKLVPAALDARAVKAAKAAITERYEGQFTASNRALEALTGLDLRQLGYQ